MTGICVTNSINQSLNTIKDKSSSVNSSINFEEVLDSAAISKSEVDGSDLKKVFKLCARSGANINSLEAYVSMRNTHSDTSGLSDSDYEAEYEQYIEYCGCVCEQELKEINSYGYKTKDALLQDVKCGLSYASNIIRDASGFSIDEEDLDKLMYRSSIKDLTEFVNSDRTSVSKILKSFTTLLDKTAELCKLSDIEYSKYLKFLSTTVESLRDIILDYYNENKSENTGFQENGREKSNGFDRNEMLILNLI